MGFAAGSTHPTLAADPDSPAHSPDFTRLCVPRVKVAPSGFQHWAGRFCLEIDPQPRTYPLHPSESPVPALVSSV